MPVHNDLTQSIQWHFDDVSTAKMFVQVKSNATVLQRSGLTKLSSWRDVIERYSIPVKQVKDSVHVCRDILEKAADLPRTSRKKHCWWYDIVAASYACLLIPRQ